MILLLIVSLILVVFITLPTLLMAIRGMSIPWGHFFMIAVGVTGVVVYWLYR